MLTVEIEYKPDDTLLSQMAHKALHRVIDAGLYAVKHTSNCCQALDEFAHAVKDNGFWVYRGGHHVALHFSRPDGMPWDERAAIIRAEKS